MKPLTFQVNARRFVREEDHALLLDDDAPTCAVRLALVMRGSEQHVFPALALDDWGHEKKGLGLYHWLYEEGTRFPRAEIFGFDAAGAEIQVFLRDLEISFRYPCFVYGDASAPVNEGRRLHTVFIPGAPGQPQAQKIDPPDHLPWSLRQAAVRWRQINEHALLDSGWRQFAIGE